MTAEQQYLLIQIHLATCIMKTPGAWETGMDYLIRLITHDFDIEVGHLICRPGCMWTRDMKCDANDEAK